MEVSIHKFLTRTISYVKHGHMRTTIAAAYKHMERIVIGQLCEVNMK